ncbi:MAG TPA: hypothetical protein VMU95_37905 [Trebonia sp.]|nr:hypothetical protein [Trebonia sp.]
MAHANLTVRRRPGTGRKAAIIVSDQAGSGALAIRPCRLRDRLLARALATSLDRRLAAGEPPESGRLLAARARALVKPAQRVALARDWERLLVVARQPPRSARPGIPLRRAAIIAAAPAIAELAARLRVSLPLGARGVAAALTLISGGGGPLYNRHAPVSLEAALADAIGWLDPALPLLAGAADQHGLAF